VPDPLCYVIGRGRTRYGNLTQSLSDLLCEAVGEALTDAQMCISDVGAIYVGNFLAGLYENQLHLNSLLWSLFPGLDSPIIRVESACASGGVAVYDAIMALSRFRRTLAVGVEKMTDSSVQRSTQCLAAAGDAIFDQREGLIFPASYALVAQQHMLRYGTTGDDLAAVSAKNHANANLNPKAHFHGKQVSLDQIKASPMVASPLRLFDCSPISDGAAAVVLSRDSLDDRSVPILGSAIANDTLSLCERTDLTTFRATRAAASEAYRQAGITAHDIDIAQVHDCFTIAELVEIEDLGLCEPGHAAGMTRDGRTSLRGDIPVNTSGGLKADGHPIGSTGVGQICELVTQLRGEAGERQVDCHIGAALNIGGVGGTAVLHVLGGR
jgi:acetyl-CoA C-acetyltransferase